MALPGIGAAVARAFRAAPTLTWIGNQQSSANLTTYSFNVVVPRPGLLIVGAAGRGTALSNVASGLAGVNPLIPANNFAPLNFSPAEVLSGAVPAGTHSVQITFAAPMLRAGIGSWLLEGYAQDAPLFAQAVEVGDGVSYTTSLSANIEVARAGIGVVVACKSDLNTASSNFTGATLRGAAASEIAFAWGDYSQPEWDDVVQTITATYASSLNPSMALASW